MPPMPGSEDGSGSFLDILRLLNSGVGLANMTGLGAGSGLGSLLSAAAPWTGPIGIGLGIASRAKEWSGGGLEFGRTKDASREAMQRLGPDASAWTVAQQISGRPLWQSPSSATGPLGLLDSYGDLYGRTSPTYQSLESSLFRQSLGPTGQEIDEQTFRSMRPDAQSRGLRMITWRGHPTSEWRYGFRPMTEEDIEERRRLDDYSGGNA